MNTRSNLLWYLDASVIAASFQGDNDRLRHLRVIFGGDNRSQFSKGDNRIQLVTIANAIPEVGAVLHRAEKNLDSLLVDIRAFWRSGQIRLVKCSRLVGETAEELRYKAIAKGWKLHPVDALHLAAADVSTARLFLTYRAEELKKFEMLTKTSLVITEPQVDNPLLIVD